MTVLFRDSFTGSGTNTGRSPDVGFGGLSWGDFSPSFVAPTVESGYLTGRPSGTSDGQFALAFYGVEDAEFGNPPDISVTVKFKTAFDFADYPTIESSTNAGILLVFRTGNIGYSIGVMVQRNGVGGPLEWYFFCGDSSVIVTSQVALNTDLVISFDITAGVTSATFAGQTLTYSEAFDSPNGLSYVQCSLGLLSYATDLVITSDLKTSFWTAFVGTEEL